MAELPVVLLAFANSRDAHLDMLKRESASLYMALEALEDRQLLTVHREESASLDEIFYAFNRFKGRIAIFHFGGHANGASLHLDDQSANAEGLATLIAAEPNLQLVFLNGCSTQGQVRKLLQLGIKAVIATDAPINDAKATEFAEFFYRALANKNNIKGAFDFAVSFLKAKYTDSPKAEIYRGFHLKNTLTNVFDWGLYTQESADNVLSWTLPTQFVAKVQRPDEGNYEVNDFIYPILKAIVENVPILEKELIDSDGNDIDEREYLAKIIENFPWAIGAQLRRLVSNDAEMGKLTETRLLQIVSTYVVSVQVLFYIMLSQLWDNKRTSSFQPKMMHLDTMSLHAQNFGYFDYLAHIRQIVHELKADKIPLFVPEIEQVVQALAQKQAFFNAYLYLESLRQQIHQKNHLFTANIAQSCADAEYALSVLLSQVAFLARYQMLTIRDIVISSPRHQPATFNHYMGRLNAYDGDFLSLFKKPRPYEIFTNTRSVILVRDLRNVKEFLNLSPFIIDKNAFGDGRATATDLYLFAYQDADAYHYVVCRNNIFKSLDNPADRLHSKMEERLESPTPTAASRRLRRVNTEETVIRPYEILHQQFELMKKDFSAV